MLCEGVAGQELARGYFARALSSGRLSHAYLLVGPEGVGKRRFADELAAALLCQGGRAEGACGRCDGCRQLASGNHLAFLAITPPAGKLIEIGVIRGAIEELSLRAGERRVVVIDGADRFSEEAANALLKTLEEPPPAIIFLLVTSYPARLLATIHSRCQRVPFTPLTAGDLEEALRRLGEDPEAYGGLHQASGGSPGRAIRLLRGIEECQGRDRLEELLQGRGTERPEALIDLLLPRPKESKRERVHRLLELLLDFTWGERGRRPSGREEAARRALRLAELIRDVDGYQSPELILEEVAMLLSR